MRTGNVLHTSRLSALGTALLFGLSGCGAEQASKDAKSALTAAEQATTKAKEAVEKAEAAGKLSQSLLDGAKLLDAVNGAAAAALEGATKADELGGLVSGKFGDAAAVATALKEAGEAVNNAEKAAREAQTGADALDDAARSAKAQKLPDAAKLESAAKVARDAAAAATNAAASARRAVGNAATTLPGANAAGPGARPASADDHRIELGTDKRVVITLPQMPPTRTYCTLDEVGGSGETVTVDWDPLAPRSLVRSVTLGGSSYNISCHSEAARQALDAEIDFSWMFLRNFATPVNGTPGNLWFCDPRSSKQAKNCESPNIKATVALLPKRTLSGGASPAELAPVPAMGAAQRAFGGLSDEALNELFQVVAEVVVERVQSKGLKLAQDRLQHLLCVDLVDKSVDNSKKPVAADAAKPADNGKPLMPRTCDAVRSVRLEDLAGAGRQLLDAFTQDLVTVALGTVVKTGKLGEQKLSDALVKALVTTVEASLDAAMGRQERLPGAAQRLIVALRNVAIEPGTGGLSHEAKNALQVAFMILEECHGSARCDATRIGRLAADPRTYFGLEKTNWPALSSFVTTGLRVLSPPAGTTELEQLRGAVGLVTDVVDLAFPESLSGLSIFEYTTQLGAEASGSIPKAEGLAASRLVRDLLQAAVQQDLTKMVTAAVRLVMTNLEGKVNGPALQKVAAIGGALGSYLATYTSGRAPSKEELEARRDARKKAIFSLIDAQTERRSRMGDVVFSVGGSVGLLAGIQPKAGEQGDRFRLQPSLSLGFGLDYHLRGGWGVHLEAMPFNLGSYASLVTGTKTLDANGNATSKDADAVATPSPGDALSPSLTLAATYVVKSADLVVILPSPTIGFAAKIGNTEADPYRGFYAGVTAGAYVPIFDFN